MHVIQDLIEDHGLDDELEVVVVEYIGNTPCWLGHISGFDGDSDTPDPEATLKEELGERHTFVDAAAMVLDAKRAQLSWEHARKR